MINKEKFDCIIKENLSELYGKEAFGYELSKNYENYYTKQEFDEFIEEMKQPKYLSCYNSYYKGKGSELKVQTGRYGAIPPKWRALHHRPDFAIWR